MVTNKDRNNSSKKNGTQTFDSKNKNDISNEKQVKSEKISDKRDSKSVKSKNSSQYNENFQNKNSKILASQKAKSLKSNGEKKSDDNLESFAENGKKQIGKIDNENNKNKEAYNDENNNETKNKGAEKDDKSKQKVNATNSKIDAQNLTTQSTYNNTKNDDKITSKSENTSASKTTSKSETTSTIKSKENTQSGKKNTEKNNQSIYELFKSSIDDEEKNESQEKDANNGNIVRKWWLDALIFIGGTILFGFIAKLLGGEMFGFKGFEMPPATAPQNIFPIIWIIVYIAIGISTFVMWRDKEIKECDRKINLVLFVFHMVFNILWPLFFFRLNLPVFSAIWLVAVIGLACACMYRYFVCNIFAGIIFNIYTLWLIYALYLNLGLVLINFC